MVGLLPDCLRAHLSGTLEDIEATVCATEPAPSLAARQARPVQVGQPVAERWTRYRVRRVQRCLKLVVLHIFL